MIEINQCHIEFLTYALCLGAACVIGIFIGLYISDLPGIWLAAREKIAYNRYVHAEAELKEALARQEQAKASQEEAIATEEWDRVEKARRDRTLIEQQLSIPRAANESDS